MSIRLKLAILFGALAGMLFAVGLPAVASAHVPTVVPGASCTHVGDRGQHDGHDYICQQKRGETCPVWHSVPQPGASMTWTHQPCPCESTSPTATPSHTPMPTVGPSGSATVVTTPSKTTAPPPTGSASPAGGTTTDQPTRDASTTPVAATGTLPVTGSPVIWIVAAGILLTLAGLALRAVRARRNAV